MPYVRQIDDSAPADDPDAIAVEKIGGPVLTLCGAADQLWDSCRYGDASQQRLQHHHARCPRPALSYPDAGHAVDLPVPYEPVGPAQPGALPTYGSTPTANDRARTDAWPRILDFIRRPS